MTNPNRVSARTAVLVAAVILGAVLARILGVYNIYPKTMGIFRSLLYMGLFIVWGFSARQRIIGARARRYLTTIAILMILWFIVRSLKYYFVTTPVIVRYLWYFYYPALLMIPMLAALTAISIGKREEDPLPKSVAFLYVPAVLLVLLVLTNDLHQLVFRFPTYDTVWSDKDYSYGYGYYAKVVYHDVDSYSFRVEDISTSRFEELYEVKYIFSKQTNEKSYSTVTYKSEDSISDLPDNIREKVKII